MNEHGKRVLAELLANKLTVDDLMDIARTSKQAKSSVQAAALTKARWYIAASEYRRAERDMRGLRL